MCEAVAFFESHKDWETFKSQGILAVISDFRGENASLSGEVLNLLNRRQVQFQILERSKPLPAPTQGLKAMLWLDKEAPSAEQHSQLLAFVRQGGLVIAATYWGPPEVKPTKKDPSLPYKMYNVGKGQIAVAEEGFPGSLSGGSGYSSAGESPERSGASLQPGSDELPFEY